MINILVGDIVWQNESFIGRDEAIMTAINSGLKTFDVYEDENGAKTYLCSVSPLNDSLPLKKIEPIKIDISKSETAKSVMGKSNRSGRRSAA